LQGGNSLYEQGFISFSQFDEIRRLKVQADGERERFVAEIARAMDRIAETELQILQLEQDRRTEVLAELQAADNQLAELVEQRVAIRDQLARIEIRSPQDGIVHELQVHTIGGVIAAGETIMLIVPAREELMVETRLRPTDINHVQPGQETILRFSAFNHSTTPEISGTVRTVAADLSRDPVSGEGWYTARIAIAAEQLARLDGLPLVPGMPVEAFVQTGSRTAFSYLLKPLADQVARAMREE
jgi:HlyD family secretion protein